MDYGKIERHTFKTYLIFSGFALFFLLASFAFVYSSNYRISQIIYNEDLGLDFSSINKLKGTSIWLANDRYNDEFYTDNPTVEMVFLIREVPLSDTIFIEVKLSEKLAYVNDARQTPPKSFVLYKNLYQKPSALNEGLLKVSITNGPVVEGFFEELATFVLTLKKYSINMSNLLLIHNGEEVVVNHFDTTIYIGEPKDLARKATLVGYYVSEDSCNGEIYLVYTEDGKDLRGYKKCD